MLNESSIELYDYLYRTFYDVVTKNVYSMGAPQELTESDTTEGFIVLHVGDIYDESEFSRQAYGEVRCYVEAFVPPISRGRLDFDKYSTYEDAINNTIHNASKDNSGVYYIEEDSVIGSGAMETSNANNVFFTFIKSFIVNINATAEQQILSSEEE